MQTETEIQKLIALLNDPDRVALGNLGAKEVIPYLIDLMLKDPDDDVRCATYLIDLINELDDKVKQLEGQ